MRGTTWHSHNLAPGVTLQEGRRKDARGYVDMHVLSVDVTNKHLRFEPLVHRLAQRSPLTNLAAHRKGLVAATNTGYFDYDSGTPLGPVVGGDQPWVGSSARATVVGLSTAGLAQAGHVALTGSVTKVEWGNPHIWVYLDVKDEGGSLRSWQCEGGAPNTLTRHGWSKDSLKFNDRITVDGWLAKDGSKTCNLRVITLPDGRSVFAGSSGGDNPTPPKP